jgi:hypothetical protein
MSAFILVGLATAAVGFGGVAVLSAHARDEVFLPSLSLFLPVYLSHRNLHRENNCSLGATSSIFSRRASQFTQAIPAAGTRHKPLLATPSPGSLGQRFNANAFHKGGFELNMSLREACLILGVE